MSPDASTSGAFLEALRQHLPTNLQWTPSAAGAVLALIGLIFMLRGARLAPVLAAMVFLGIGAALAPVLSHALGTPPLPTLVISATIGLVLGVVMFRLWFALLVAFSLVAAGVGIYGGKVALPVMGEYQFRGLRTTDSEIEITLPGPANGALGWGGEAAEMWSFLRQRQPNVEVSLGAVVLFAGAAGLALAFFLPRAARSFWAATTGTVLFVPATYTLTQLHAPSAAVYYAQYGMLIAAVLWSASLIVNLADMLGWWRKKNPAAASAQ